MRTIHPTLPQHLESLARMLSDGASVPELEERAVEIVRRHSPDEWTVNELVLGAIDEASHLFGSDDLFDEFDIISEGI